MKLRTLIAEDEPGVRSFLSGLCARRPELEIVAQVDTGSAAIDIIRARQPNLLLLEAELPDMTGLDVLRTAGTDGDPYGVIVTKHPEHHLAELQSGSLSYLTKPVSRRQFDRVIDAAIARRAVDHPAVAPAGQLRGLQLIGERAHRFYFLDAHGVDYLEAHGNYVVIHVGHERFLTRTTLKHLSSMLPAQEFARIDRSLLVNLRRVAYVERQESGRFAFTLRDGQQLMSSRERSAAIVRLLRAGVR